MSETVEVGADDLRALVAVVQSLVGRQSRLEGAVMTLAQALAPRAPGDGPTAKDIASKTLEEVRAGNTATAREFVGLKRVLGDLPLDAAQAFHDHFGKDGRHGP